jgi:hypothetical protein
MSEKPTHEDLERRIQELEKAESELSLAATRPMAMKRMHFLRVPKPSSVSLTN